MKGDIHTSKNQSFQLDQGNQKNNSGKTHAEMKKIWIKSRINQAKCFPKFSRYGEKVTLDFNTQTN